MQFDIRASKGPEETAMSAVNWQQFGTQRRGIAVVTHLKRKLQVKIIIGHQL
jgi:hypothetical protein